MRARAANRDLLMVNLSDPEARIARIVLEHVADVLDGQPEPKIERPTVMKRPGV